MQQSRYLHAALRQGRETAATPTPRRVEEEDDAEVTSAAVRTVGAGCSRYPRFDDEADILEQGGEDDL